MDGRVLRLHRQPSADDRTGRARVCRPRRAADRLRATRGGVGKAVAAQSEPRFGKIKTRSKCCHDCAYRQGSPERTRGEDLAEFNAGIFYCHEGMRRIIAYEHPDGRRIEEENPGAYDPPTIGEIAYQASGAPAKRCAGWASHQPEREE